MSSDLITLLEREANAERERVLAEARTQSEAIRAEAQRQADELLAHQRERLEGEGKAALVKAQSTAQLRASSMVLQAKEQEIAAVFAHAEAELARLRTTGESYAPALRALIEEAHQGFSGRVVITVNPADHSVAETLARERRWDAEVRTDPAVQGGVRVSSTDGRLFVTNTLASRLERARPLLAAEIARALWG